MGDNITSNNEQRQHTGGGGGNGACASNVVSRKKTNNGGGGDVTASPKYNKSNPRGYNRESQQQKQYRGTNNREQRGGGNSRYRNAEQQSSYRNERSDCFDLTGVDDENPDDVPSEIFDFDEQCSQKRGGTTAKKTNMSHLLNFHYLDKQRINVRGNRRSSNSNYYLNNRSLSTGSSFYRQTFSKEQFLQANCQFIVPTGTFDYSIHLADPDVAIDWSRVEQVRLHSMQPLKCPICLSEPQAGKITRCGHVYCWSCLLHYLSLSDQPWRKCPVCAESIYKQDIRSAKGIVSRSLKSGDWVTFRLMCRERGSILFNPRKSFEKTIIQNEPERLTIDGNQQQQYAHLLLADEQIILNEIIEKEKLDLLKQLEEDGDQPEACFIKQALEENNEREKIVRERMEKSKLIVIDEPKVKSPKPVEALLPLKPVVVYDNAFDDVVESVPEEKDEPIIEEKIETPSPVVSDKTPTQASASNAPANRHYFYQANDIYHAYLNGFNTRMLLHEYGSYQQCPDEIHVRVEAIESFFMTEDLRSQFRSLNHLPLTCEFQIIEVRIHPPLISSATMQFFTDEIHRRRQYRTRKERLENRRQQRAEYAETQKLFSQYPPEMMYHPQESFPVNGTNSMEEFPAMISSATSSSPPSASVQISDENLSPPTGVSFAQMLKQQAPLPPPPKPLPTTKSTANKTATIEISSKTKKNKKKNNNDSDDELANEDEEYYSSVPNFHSSFSLEEVFDRLKLVNGEEHPVTSISQTSNNAPTKKKNKKNKQILFATGLGGQAKL